MEETGKKWDGQNMGGSTKKGTPQEKGEVSASFFGGKGSDPRQEEEDDDAEMVDEDSVQELET